MRAAIISNGQIDDYEYIKKYILESDILICADGGGEHAFKMGLIPDVLIGDFDSISEDTLKLFEKNSTSVFKYKREKDQTDTELAVDCAISKGADEIILIGGTGKRLDHTYANISLLVVMRERDIEGLIIDEYNEIRVIDKFLRMQGDKNDKISLLAFTPEVCGVTTRGLKYPLKDGVLKNDNTLGISNEFLDSEAEIEVKSGILLVIKARD